MNNILDLKFCFRNILFGVIIFPVADGAIILILQISFQIISTEIQIKLENTGDHLS